MSLRILALTIATGLLLTACSSGSGTPGNIVYDTNTTSPVARFSNGYANVAPALGTISRVQYDEGSDTLTITDPSSPSTPITVQTATSVTANQQNLRSYVGGTAFPDVNAPPGSPALGNEIEVLSLNSENRNSWAVTVRETDYDTSIPNFVLRKDIGRSGAYGGDVYTAAIDSRRTGPNGNATMNGQLIFTRRIVTDAIAFGISYTRNGRADVALNVDFANGMVGGNVSNFNEVNAVTGAQTPASGTPVVYTLPDTALAADGSFAGTNTTNLPLNGGNDQRTAFIIGQINGPTADEASGAIQLDRTLTGSNGFGFGGETLRGTFVAAE